MSVVSRVEGSMRRSLTKDRAMKPVAMMPQRTGLGDVFDMLADVDAVR